METIKWHIFVLPNGKVALLDHWYSTMYGMKDTYLQRVHDYYPAVNKPTKADWVVGYCSEADLAKTPSAQWTVVGLNNGKVALQADNGLYMGSCVGCLGTSLAHRNNDPYQRDGSNSNHAAVYVIDPLSDVNGQLSIGVAR